VTSDAIDVCFALDQSGSICSGGQQLCNNCDCQSGGSSQLPLCCPNYVSATDFAIEFINEVELQTPEGTSQSKYGVVFFSNENSPPTEVGQSLNSNPTLSTNILRTDPYVGGYTNTASGFRLCNGQLFDSGSNAKRFLVMLTDGNPTACNNVDDTPTNSDDDACGCESLACAPAATAAANHAAAAARARGYIVIPVGVGNSISTTNLANWGTGGRYLIASDFSDLQTLISSLLNATLCS
jgi:hypothetical protein